MAPGVLVTGHSAGPRLPGGCALQSLPTRLGGLSRELLPSVGFGTDREQPLLVVSVLQPRVEWEGGREGQEAEMQECGPFGDQGR